MTIHQFPHSRIKRDSGASAELMLPSCNPHKQRQSPAASAPVAAGQLGAVALAFGVFAFMAIIAWWGIQ